MASTREEMITLLRKYLFDSFLFGYSEEELSNDTSFLEIGVLDSIGIMEVVSFIEQNFAVRFQDSEIIPENLDTVNRMADFIRRKLG